MVNKKITDDIVYLVNKQKIQTLTSNISLPLSINIWDFTNRLIIYKGVIHATQGTTISPKLLSSERPQMAVRGILQRFNAHPRGKGPRLGKGWARGQGQTGGKKPKGFFKGLGLNFLKESLVYLILWKFQIFQQDTCGIWIVKCKKHVDIIHVDFLLKTSRQGQLVWQYDQQPV